MSKESVCLRERERVSERKGKRARASKSASLNAPPERVARPSRLARSTPPQSSLAPAHSPSALFPLFPHLVCLWLPVCVLSSLLIHHSRHSHRTPCPTPPPAPKPQAASSKHPSCRGQPIHSIPFSLDHTHTHSLLASLKKKKKTQREALYT